MTSILVSSDDLELGENIGSKIAADVGLRYVGRALLEQVAAEAHLKLEDLRRFLSPNGRNRFSKKTQRLCLAHAQAATLGELQRDGVVCAGLAAHLYVREVSHVLSLRVIADPQERINRLVTKKRMSRRAAMKTIERERARATQWSVEAFGIDENNPAIYDLVVGLGHIDEDKIVEMVKDMAGYRNFQPMTYSRKCMDDLVHAGMLRAALLAKFPDIRTSADGDTATVRVKCSKREKVKTVEEIKKLAAAVPTLKRVEVHTVTSMRELEKE